jgi:hypothetical protein
MGANKYTMVYSYFFILPTIILKLEFDCSLKLADKVKFPILLPFCKMCIFPDNVEEVPQH